MSKIKMYYDSKGETLSMWFDDPKKEVQSEEIGDGTIISKDSKGKIIGFGKLSIKFSKPTLKYPSPVEFSLV